MARLCRDPIASSCRIAAPVNPPTNSPSFSLDDILFGRTRIPKLAASAIHVWQVVTAPNARVSENCRKFLNAEECERADRFHFEKDRCAYTVCRALLRSLLSQYSGIPANEIQLAFSSHGKPFLKNSPSLPAGISSPPVGISASPAQFCSPAQIPSPVRFNVSHSGERGLLAFANDREVGIDIEFKRPDVDFAALARSPFSQRECSAVVALPLPKQAELFYEYWSCKEACIKCDGRGLSVPLGGFSVIQGAQPLWRAVEADRSALLPPNLRIKILSGESQYAAAVAAVGDDWDVERFLVSNSLSSD